MSLGGGPQPAVGGGEGAPPHTIDTRSPEPARSPRQILSEVVLVLPRLALLLARLLGDPQVPRRRKLLVGAAVAYVAAPIDLIPDVVPVVGQFDDAIVVAFAVHHLMCAVPGEVRAGYWSGSEDALDLVEAVLAWGAEMVPPQVRRIIGG